MDAVFVAESLMELARQRGGKLLLVFVDFTKAFDTIDRERLWDKLRRMGVPERVLSMFRMAYGEVWGRIRDEDGSWSPYVSFRTGVKQGDPLSTLFFILFLNDIVNFLRLNGARGVDVGPENLVALLFADDTTLAATSVKDAQRLLDLLSQYASINKLEVNVSKTQWMGLHVGDQSAGLHYRGARLTKEDTFCYLGYHLTATGRKHSHVDGRRTKTLAAYGIWLKQARLQPGMSAELLLLTYNSLVATVALYGSPMGAADTTENAITGRKHRDSVGLRAIRTATGLKAATYRPAAFALSGQYPMAVRDHTMMLRFWAGIPDKDNYVQACYAALLLASSNAPASARENWTGRVHRLVHYYYGDDAERVWSEHGGPSLGIRRIVEANCAKLLNAALLDSTQLAFMRASDLTHGSCAVMGLVVKSHRRDMLQLLSGAHDLPINKLRHTGIPGCDRRCPYDPLEIGDEQHCLFACSGNALLRQALVNKLHSVQREWDMGTWAWAVRSRKEIDEAMEKRRNRALCAMATFVSRTFDHMKETGKEGVPSR